MKKVLLSNTELYVSQLSLGTVNYGTEMDTKAAKNQMNNFFELGGNFIDTAHVYGDWVPGTKGRSENIIGEWLKETGLRQEVIISTKGAHPPISDMSISRINSTEIKRDIDESLENLGTDYIDLYFLHRDDPDVPVSVALDVLELARQQGKIRYYGCSNWSLPRIIEANTYAKEHNYAGFVCNQLMWSLADINESAMTDKTLVLMDEETFNYHEKTNMSVMAYTSAAKGYFTKLFLNKDISDKISSRYDTLSNKLIFDELIKVAKEVCVSLIEVELAYIMHQQFASVPIVSFSNDEQLEQGMKSCELVLDDEVIKTFKKIKKYVV